MNKKEQKSIFGKCDRCGNDDEGMLLLRLESSIKVTDLWLCDLCMKAARAMWQHFMKEGKK